MRAGAISVNDAALTAVVHDGEKDPLTEWRWANSEWAMLRYVAFYAHKYILSIRSVEDPWWFSDNRRHDGIRSVKEREEKRMAK